MTRHLDPKSLSNDQLLQRVQSLVSRSNRGLAELLWHLAEVDARGLYREKACSSMFAYCTDRLGFSENAAYTRITAARLARKFPVVLRHIANGELHLSAVKILAKVLTMENHEQVLAQASGKKTDAVRMLAAALAPKPDVPALIRKLPTSGAAEVGVPAQTAFATEPAPRAAVGSTPSSAAQKLRPDERARRESGTVAPLRADRYKVQFSASAALREKIQRAQELMGPGRRDLEAVFDRALDELITALEKKKWGKTERAQRKVRARKTGTRYIPNRVRREVAERDGGRCTFVDEDGRRCDERRALEFHHQHAFALGGEANTENIRLLCRAHNALEAERDFGAEHMNRARGNLDPRSGRGRLPGVQPRPTLRVRDGGAVRAGLSARW